MKVQKRFEKRFQKEFLAGNKTKTQNQNQKRKNKFVTEEKPVLKQGPGGRGHHQPLVTGAELEVELKDSLRGHCGFVVNVEPLRKVR